jgi:mRNA-degrading endonuclease RelE of RelBE toxin-antitoxin system
MNTKTLDQVYKDADKVPQHVKLAAAQELEKLEKAAKLCDLGNVEKMKGTKEPYYRMKFGNYRFLLYHDPIMDTVEILSLKHRKDAYKKHNLPWR